MRDTAHISDCRHFKYCVFGVRRFCTRHGLDFRKFIDGTMPLADLEATGDAQALVVVNHVRGIGS